MQLTVQLFGPYADAAGARRVHLDLAETSADTKTSADADRPHAEPNPSAAPPAASAPISGPPTPPSAADVLGHLRTQHPALAPLLDAAPARLAVNARYADPHQPIDPADELALIGLVNGG